MRSHRLLSAGSLILVIVVAVACGGGQQDEPPERTPVPTPAGTPTPQVVHLVEDFYFDAYIIITGDTDSLAMRWLGGPPEATEWQYRVYPASQFREWVGELGGWVTVPVNERHTYVHEITGLEAGWDYLIVLRPVVAGGVGEATNLYGYVPLPDEYPPIGGGETASGDGHTQWLVYGGHRTTGIFLMTIPLGLWVRVIYHPELSEIWITEVYTRSRLILSPEGKELRREVRPSYAGYMNNLFAEVVASVRPLPEDDR